MRREIWERQTATLSLGSEADIYHNVAHPYQYPLVLEGAPPVLLLSVEVLLVPPGPHWSSSPQLQETPSLYTQGGVGGLEKEERGDDISTGQLKVLL